MTKLVLAGAFIVVAVQVCALAVVDRQSVVGVTGAALALVLIAVRWRLGSRGDTAGAATTNDAEEALRRWHSRTETLISWAEASRADWDRRLRPMLARQFELAAGQRKAKNPLAFEATGRMLFGDRLWEWVDPENVSRTGATEPGPGRDALNDILRRLEQL